MPDRAPTSLLHTAFYRFVPLVDPRAVADELGVLARDLQGSVVVAHEGVNGALAGEPRAVAAFEAALQRADVLGGALQRMVVNLRELVGELQEGSGKLSSASTEIFAATSQQTVGATEQSAAIAQTTTTVDDDGEDNSPIRDLKREAGIAAVVTAETTGANSLAWDAKAEG